jgi:hypothetical protein
MEVQPARSGVGGEEITGTTRGELPVARRRADVRDSERRGRRVPFLGKLDTTRNYGKNRSVRSIGMKVGGLRLMLHDAEGAVVVGVPILVVMETQSEREGRQQQDDGEEKPPAQPLIRGRCGHVSLTIPPVTKLLQQYIGIPTPSNDSIGDRPMK